MSIILYKFNEWRCHKIFVGLTIGTPKLANFVLKDNLLKLNHRKDSKVQDTLCEWRSGYDVVVLLVQRRKSEKLFYDAVNVIVSCRTRHGCTCVRRRRCLVWVTAARCRAHGCVVGAYLAGRGRQPTATPPGFHWRCSGESSTCWFRSGFLNHRN